MSKVTDYLKSMEGDVTNPDMWTKEQAQECAAEYWRIRWDKSLSHEEMQCKLGEMPDFKPVREVWTNDRGRAVINRHWSIERYTFDFDDDFCADGWRQFDTDQDALYYGVWVNPKTLRTLSYAEGDVTLVICPDADHYNAEIKDACEFHGEGFEFIACGDAETAEAVLLGGDTFGKDITVCRQDRSKFFVSDTE